MTARHYSDEEVRALRDRARVLMADLAEVFDQIAEKVAALHEGLGEEERGDSAAIAEAAALGYDHRATGRRGEADHS